MSSVKREKHSYIIYDNGKINLVLLTHKQIHQRTNCLSSGVFLEFQFSFISNPGAVVHPCFPSNPDCLQTIAFFRLQLSPPESGDGLINTQRNSNFDLFRLYVGPSISGEKDGGVRRQRIAGTQTSVLGEVNFGHY